MLAVLEDGSPAHLSAELPSSRDAGHVKPGEAVPVSH